jgi:hypothetical protein
MSDHLWPLVRLEASTEEKLVEAYRQLFLETYVESRDGKTVELYDWYGSRIHFNQRIFDHAFSESSNYRFGSGVHNIPFSTKRARCILWIREVLTASGGTIEVRQQFRKDSRNRSKKRRVLLVVEEKYVVVLEERPNHKEYEFVSAFPADEAYVQKIRKESLLLETKKPQS